MSLLSRASLTILYILQRARLFAYRLVGRIERANGARAILIKDGNVLLVTHAIAPFIWCLPGGGIASNESPESAITREVSEETGLLIKKTSLLGTYKMGKRGPVVYVFVSDDISGDLAPYPNLEIFRKRWFSLTNLPENIMPAHRKRITEYLSGSRGERGQRS